ncbi:MAG: hypothetical protein IJZ79_05960 [Bacilli bacterium]|nr:hypothetical protein [Bacilli bacterium]
MNIKQFLLDNYIWILVVILLLIITIIGFLADKKKGQNKKKDAEQPQPMPVNNQQVPPAPINFQPNISEQSASINYPNGISGQMPINPSNELGTMNNGFNPNQNNPVNFGTIPNATVTPINTVSNNNIVNTIPTDNTFNQMNVPNNQFNGTTQTNEVNNVIPTPVINDMNSSINNFNQLPPVENMSQINNLQPLGDNLYVGQQNIPQPVDNLNQVDTQNTESMYQPLSEQKPTFAPREVNIPSDNINNFDNQSSVNNNENMMYNNINMNQNMNLNNQISNFSQPQEIVNNFENTPIQPIIPTPMPSQEQNTIPNPITPPQPVSPQPVNFVYGPQQSNNNNNQFM